jgi:tRNA threonylcarbamoyl adenosine modification protein YeaZ
MMLVIDSASEACSAALLDGWKVLGERHEVVGRGHAERLIPMIQELLGGRRPREILVNCGPGSFTGVRVGLAAAHGLSIGWGVPLSGYSSLALIAAGAVVGAEIGVALHAGHGQLFVQTYDRDPFLPRDELRSLLPEDAAAAISAHHVYGSGAEALVNARGSGEAHGAELRAAEAMLLPLSLRTLAPRPIYGRAPDAKPMP